MTRLALEEFPVAVFADEFSIAHGNLATGNFSNASRVIFDSE